MNKVPVNVVTGQLGSGKTTVILNLIKQLPDDYKVVWLKNEYGDVNIDSDLAAESNILTKEVLNGCICCVLIGRLGEAVKEILTDLQPERLIIETAGTAFPYPIVDKLTQIKEIKLDSLVTVIDALNFEEFAVKNQLAKDQAKYIDLVVVNKTKEVDQQDLDKVMDDVYDLYLNSPKVQTADGFVDKDLILGIDSTLLSDFVNSTKVESHPDDEHEHNHAQGHEDIDVFNIIDNKHTYNYLELKAYLDNLNGSDFYRIKGIANIGSNYKLLNYVAGRSTWEDLKTYDGPTKFIFIGKGISRLSAKVEKEFSHLRMD